MSTPLRHILSLIFAVLLVSCGQNDCMRQTLEQAERMNQHDSLFTSDSIGLSLVRYYDHWWHPANLRLRAYYMLGCAYRDMGDKTIALRHFETAVQKADTLDPNCDYATLSRIFGEMGAIYGEQSQPYEHLHAYQEQSHLALKAGDTLLSIGALAHTVGSYSALGDTATMMNVANKVRRLFLQRGEHEQAARVYDTPIYTFALKGDYNQVRRLLDIYERESGLFDEHGNIQPGNELYYYSKGLLYKGTNKTDSAEYYFRRLMASDYSMEASEALLSIYQARENADSIEKYEQIHQQEKAKRAIRSRMSIHAAQLSESKYEQAQSRHLASQKESEARMAWYLFLFVAAALALVLSIVYIIYNKVRHRTRQRDEALQQTRDKLQKAEAQIGNWDMALREEQLQGEEIVQLFVAMAHKEYNGKRPTKREWGKLTSVFKRHMPHVWSQFVNSKLSDQERLVALLTLIDIPSNAIATLLDISPQAVGNAKSGANQKLSGEKSASALLATLKKVSQVADPPQPTQH